MEAHQFLPAVNEVKQATEVIYESKERLKPVIRGTWGRFHNTVVHLLPIAATVALIYINIARLFWFPADGPGGASVDTVLNALQLLAKLYEILVIASLASITLKIFKRRLVGSGLPLGLLTGGYRVGDLTYLISGPFWRNWSALSIFLALNTILATIAGPASAILIVPGLDWYPLKGAITNIEAVHYDSIMDRAWPTIVDSSFYDEILECQNEWGTWAYWCPAAGFSELWAWLKGWEHSGLTNNLQFQEPAASIRRQLLLNEPEGNPVTFSTTVSASSILSIGRFLNYLKSRDVGSISQTHRFKLTTTDATKIYQPLVQTQCQVYERNDLFGVSGEPGAFNASHVNCFNDETCGTMLTNSRNMVFSDGDWNRTDWEPDFEYSIIASPLNETLPLMATMKLPFKDGSDIKTWMVACVIVAHWAPASVTIDPATSDLVESNVSDTSVFSRPEMLSGQTIRIDESWIDYLSPRFNITYTEENGTSTTLETRVLSTLMNPFMKHIMLEGKEVVVFNPETNAVPDAATIGNFVQRSYSAIITEGLARVNSKNETLATLSMNDTSIVMADMSIQRGLSAANVTFDWSSGSVKVTVNDEIGNSSYTPEGIIDEYNKMVLYEFDVQQYGYGFGVPGPTMRFGLAVIFLYLGILAVYSVSVLLRRWPTVAAWDDLQDLLILVWNSASPPQLWRSGAGIESKATWRMDTRIRVDAMGKVQLVGDEKPDMFELRKNVRYS